MIDMGGPGPDAGKGGKYLILPPDFKGERPKDKADGGEYFVAQSTCYVNWVPLRGFLEDGKPDGVSPECWEAVNARVVERLTTH